MNYADGREKFIASWGDLAVKWGISRTMGIIHGLLLCTTKPLCGDQIMERLNVSRGSANQNIRALVQWGLAYKQVHPESRRDYYVAEKDIWAILRAVVIRRKKNELEPMIQVLREISAVEGKCKESDAFCNLVSQLHRFSSKTNEMLQSLASPDSSEIMQRMFASAFEEDVIQSA